MNVSAESGAPRRAGQRHEVGLAQLPPAPPTTVAVIEGLATGTPRRVVNQSDAADRVAELFLDPGQRERIPRVYQKSRITTRRMAVDPLEPNLMSSGGNLRRSVIGCICSTNTRFRWRWT